MKKAIVTGASGFLGSSLIKKLVSNQVEVVLINRTKSDGKFLKHDLITEIEIGLDDVDALIKSIPKDVYDVFYHFAWAGVNGLAKADPITQIRNIEMAINCATVAKKIGCKKILYAGSIAEQAIKSLSHLEKVNGGMMYGSAKHATHLMVETYCKNIDLEFVWMQFSNIYGPDNKTGNLISYTISELLKGHEATFGPALQPYDFIYIEDLMEAVYRIGKYETSGNFYFIGSGEPRQLKDYLMEIGNIYGKPELIKLGFRPDDGIKYTYDMLETKNLEREIGNYVSTSFSEGIRHTIENY